ncbi:unnamed protein product [Cyprideis torosa]|uniref:Uncharacterized protein n=1 Tax=Cyprideis torosa TaxID=163714 RepID=A0A7R8W916_9CRUS|nr:unnamed protein product [Cyprideis torosa]CAG0884893.1 unnamed protein product [Cyprideis torosa]
MKYEATDMNIFRSALAACVVEDLPNIRDYIHQHRENLMEEKRQKLLALHVSAVPPRRVPVLSSNPLPIAAPPPAPPPPPAAPPIPLPPPNEHVDPPRQDIPHPERRPNNNDDNDLAPPSP